MTLKRNTNRFNRFHAGMALILTVAVLSGCGGSSDRIFYRTAFHLFDGVLPDRCKRLYKPDKCRCSGAKQDHAYYGRKKQTFIIPVDISCHTASHGAAFFRRLCSHVLIKICFDHSVVYLTVLCCFVTDVTFRFLV